MERLLVLGAGAAQLGLLEAAHARGLFVIAVDRDPAAPGFASADRRAIVPVDDEPALERLAEAEHIDGVIAPGENSPVGAAARIAARLGLPHPLLPETAVLSTSKLRQRERLAEAGVPQGWPVVSTPLAEQPVVSVSGYSCDGAFHALTVTDRVEDAELWESKYAGPAVALARAAVESLGIREGVSMSRIRVDPDGPKVLEVNAGLGTGAAELCRAALGIDPYALMLAGALGEPVSERRLRPRRRAAAACLRFLTDGEVVLATGSSREEALAECVRFRAADAQVV